MPFSRSKILLLNAVLAMPAGCRGGAEQAEAETEEMSEMHAAGDSAGNNSVVFSAAQVQHGSVQWDSVVMTSTASTAVAPGTIVPDEDQTARMGAPAQGRVIAVRVRPGDRVAPGQVLVTLQSPEAGAAQADVEKAEAELTSRRAQAAYAKSARDRAERLLALKAISRQEYERAIADDELARAEQAQAESELRRAVSTAAQLGAGSNSGEVALTAPISGVVLSRSAVPGAVVEAGTPLVTVTNLSRLWLTVDVPEQHAQLLRVGVPLEFSVPAYPADLFTARIEAVGAGLDPQTRTLPIRAGVPNRDGRLKPEMLASVRIQGAESVPAVILPADAVQVLGGKPVVFITTPDGNGGARFTAQEVEVGDRSGGRVAVTRGLLGGERVVIRGAFAVKAQMEKSAMPEMEH